MRIVGLPRTFYYVSKNRPVEVAPEPRIPGNDEGKVVIAADFDAPLPEFEP